MPNDEAGLGSPAASSEPSAPDTQPRRRNYLVRHWRGELSLAVSYWVNGFLSNIVAIALVAGLAVWTANLRTNYHIGIMWSAVWGALTLLAVWQAVGVWRSAQRRVREGGTRGWARAAQVMVVIGVLRFASSLMGDGIPAISAGFKHAAWLGEHGRWTIRLLRDGKELDISGGIGHGFADDLNRILSATPTVTIVHLNLPSGGLIDEAKRARDLIREHGLSTYVSNTCVSACTLVYLGGTERYLKNNAKIGFHSPSLPGLSLENSATLRAREREYLISIGVTPAFAARVLGTESTEMWYPTHEELLDGGVVTAITSGDDFAISGSGGPPDRQALSAELRQSRLYRVLELNEPGTYERIVEVATEALREGKSVNELRARTAPLLQPVFRKRLPTADDAAVLRFARLLVAQLEALRGAPGSVCFDYIMGRHPEAAGKAVRYLPASLVSEERETIADVIESPGNGRKATDARFQQLIARVLNRIGRQEPGHLEVLETIDDAGVDPIRGCLALHALYAGILRLPERDSAPMLRSMFASR